MSVQSSALKGRNDLGGIHSFHDASQDVASPGTGIHFTPALASTREELLAENDSLRLQLEKLQEKHRQAQRMEAIGQLAGGIAHDFNNVLTIITGYSHMLLQSRLDEDARELLREIQEAGLRASALTTQLLAYSRKQELDPLSLDLNCIVIETERMLRRVIGADVSLELSLQPSLSLIKGDPSQMEQVLMNLALNARDAMPRGGTITIATSNVFLDQAFALAHPHVVPGPYICLAVTDTGHGMTPAIQRRIFEPFFTTKGEGKGTGLGLATVHGIVTQSRGYIEVVSEPDRGTSFRIYLPALDKSKETSAGPSAQGYKKTGLKPISHKTP